MIYAVIDTNVLVSSLLSDKDSPPVRVIRGIRDGEIRPIISAYLLREYRRVLSRKELGIDDRRTYALLKLFDCDTSIGTELIDQGCMLSDPKDSPIFDIVRITREYDSYLVTGNIKHYPAGRYVITPRQMADLLDGSIGKDMRVRD